MKKTVKKVAGSIGIILIIYGLGLWILAPRGNIVDTIYLMMLLGLTCFVILFLLWLPNVRAYWNTKEYKKKMSKLKPTLFQRIFIWKFLWMECIYQHVCLSYLKKKPEHTQVMMEDVLFLMQQESLDKHHTPMLYCKVHVVDGNIYISFLSDLIRVKAFKDIRVYNRHQPHYSKYMALYKNMLRKYQKLTQEELRNRVQAVLEKETLQPDFFSFEACKNDKYLRKARKLAFEEEYPVKSCFYWIMIWFPWMLLIVQILLVILSLFFYDETTFLAWKLGFPFAILAYISYAFDKRKFQQPSDFEKMHKEQT